MKVRSKKKIMKYWAVTPGSVSIMQHKNLTSHGSQPERKGCCVVVCGNLCASLFGCVVFLLFFAILLYYFASYLRWELMYDPVGSFRWQPSFFSEVHHASFEVIFDFVLKR